MNESNSAKKYHTEIYNINKAIINLDINLLINTPSSRSSITHDLIGSKMPIYYTKLILNNFELSPPVYSPSFFCFI